MFKKVLSVMLASGLALSLFVPASLARPDDKEKGKLPAEVLQLQANQDNVLAQDDPENEESVAEDVYGGGKGKHKGIPNALMNVKNPLARAVLQSILDGRSVSEAVYQFRNGMDSVVDPEDVDIVSDQIEKELLSSSDGSNEKARTYKYMAQIKIKAGKTNEAKKYMELSALNNPADDETFKELDSIFAKINDKSVKVYINGRTPSMDVPPRIEEGRTLVPVRFIAEGLGAQITYDGETGTVMVEGPQISIEMKIDSKNVLINGQSVELDVPATIESGRTMVPLRFISEGFKSKVNFYGQSNIVSVNS